MKQSEKINELAKALCLFQSEAPILTKNCENPFYKSSYTDLAGVVKVIQPIIKKYGLAVSQTFEPVENAIKVCTTLMHISDQYIQGELVLHPVKNDPQGAGSAITYGRRYSLMAILGLASEDDDDDGNNASKPSGGKDVAQKVVPQMGTKNEPKPQPPAGVHPTVQKVMDTFAPKKTAEANTPKQPKELDTPSVEEKILKAIETIASLRDESVEETLRSITESRWKDKKTGEDKHFKGYTNVDDISDKALPVVWGKVEKVLRSMEEAEEARGKYEGASDLPF